MSEPRVIVIGAGIAGLAAAASLADRGCAATVIEASDHVGGCAATTSVDGFTFHDGALFLVMPSMLDAAFARLGIDRAREVPLHRMEVPCAVSTPDGSTVVVRDGRIWLRRPGAAEVPVDAEATALAERWRDVLQLFMGDLMLRPFSLSRLLARSWRFLPRLRGTVGRELRRAFSDEAVQAAMGGVVHYAGVAPDRLPVASVLSIVALLDDGFYVPVGGMGAVPDAIARRLVAAGGVIRLNTAVERIAVARNRAQGVVLAGGERLEADAVISTVSAMATYKELLDRDAAGAAALRRVDAALLSHRAVGVWLGLRQLIDAPAHINAAVPMLADQHEVFSGRDPGRWLSYIASSATAPELAPPGGSTVELFVPLAPDAASPDRPTAERLADEAITALGRRHRLDIAVRRVRGPADFRTAMRLYDGRLYGLSPATSPMSLFPQRTAVRGLHLAGQTTYPGYGVAPAVVSGILAADQLAAEARLG